MTDLKLILWVLFWNLWVDASSIKFTCLEPCAQSLGPSSTQSIQLTYTPSAGVWISNCTLSLDTGSSTSTFYKEQLAWPTTPQPQAASLSWTLSMSTLSIPSNATLIQTRVVWTDTRLHDGLLIGADSETGPSFQIASAARATMAPKQTEVVLGPNSKPKPSPSGSLRPETNVTSLLVASLFWILAFYILFI